MYCEKCQKHYGANEKFCEECGSLLIDELDIYARQLRNNDERAFDKIYNHTKIWVVKYVSMHLHNQEDCMDCTQEIYFKLYNKIHLYHPEHGKFRPWFNKLIQNQVIDFARNLNQETLVEDEEIFEAIVDPQPIAEIQMDYQESSRLLHEIIDSLPEEQKACITEFYIKGKRRKEIASLFEISEETIKSRLRLAKKKIEEKVLDFQKAGTKIYGLSPFAFFLFLGALEKRKIFDFGLLQEGVTKQRLLSEKIRRDTAQLYKTENISVKTASSAGKAVFGKTVLQKSLIALISVTVIGGGGFAAYKVYNDSKTDQKQEQQGIVVEAPEEIKEVQAPEIQEKDSSEVIEPEVLESSEKSYEVILNKYRTFAQERWDLGRMLDENLSDLYKYVDVSDIGYAFVDVNNDGSKELFIGNQKGTEKGYFYEAYTIHDGEVILFAQSMERYNHYLCEDLRIEIPWSGSSEYTEADYYQLKSGMTDLEKTEVAESKSYPYYDFTFMPILEGISSENKIEGNTQKSFSLKYKEEAQVSVVAEEALELEDAVEFASSQGEKASYSASLYKLWDNELNRLWKVLKENLDSVTMKNLLSEQRKWIQNKESVMKVTGDSITDENEKKFQTNMKGAEITEERIYALLEYLE